MDKLAKVDSRGTCRRKTEIPPEIAAQIADTLPEIS